MSTQTSTKTSQGKTAEFIVESGLIDAIVDGVGRIGNYGEAVFEFREDDVRVATVDGAQVQMIDQTISHDAFEHYDVPSGFEFGFNTETLGDLSGMAGKSAPIHFDFNFERFVFEIELEDVTYDLRGIDTDKVNGRLEDEPNLDLPVTANVPASKFKRASKVIGMASDMGDFYAGTDENGDDMFYAEGAGDVDAARVDFVKDADDFEIISNERSEGDWVRSRLSQDYFDNIHRVLDEDVVRVEIGEDIPVVVKTDRYNGLIDTQIITAPRIDTSK